MAGLPRGANRSGEGDAGPGLDESIPVKPPREVVVVAAFEDHDLVHPVPSRGLLRSCSPGGRDGSRNCSHGWAVPSTASRAAPGPRPTSSERRPWNGSRATSARAAPANPHTWNVARVPEVDFGGVLADQRSAEKVVLDALRRQPDTGFAIHDAPSRVERLLAAQSELRDLLRGRPSDAAPALRQAEFALASAEKELYWAHYRLKHAEERLAGFGKVSQLRRHGREESRRPSTRSSASPGTSGAPRTRSLVVATRSKTFAPNATTDRLGMPNTIGPPSACEA